MIKRRFSLLVIFQLIFTFKVVISNRHIGQFFVSGDQEKTLVYLNHTLFIEKLDIRTHRHFQYKQDNFVLSEKNNSFQTPIAGILYGEYSIIAKEMEMFVHRINLIKFSLDFVFKIDLNCLCTQKEGEAFIDLVAEYCSGKNENDFITSIHSYFNILFIKTNQSAFILDIEELSIQMQTIMVLNHQKIDQSSYVPRGAIIKSLVSYKKLQIISDKYSDKQIEGFQFIIKNLELVILQQKLSDRNQIIIPYNLTESFFNYASECLSYFDFDMSYEQNNPNYDKGYYIMLRCDLKLKLLKITKDKMSQIYEDGNLPKVFDQQYNSIYLYSQNDQHIYGFFNAVQACFYSKPEQKLTKAKFLEQNQQNSTQIEQTYDKEYHICINNHINGVQFSHILYNDLDYKVTIILSRTTEKQTDILGQLIDKCKFQNMKESITCNICQQCSNSCSNYNLDSCGNKFMLMRFNLIIIMVWFVLILIAIYIIKYLISLVKPCLKLLGECMILLFCKVPLILNTLLKKCWRITRVKCRRLKIKLKTIFYKLCKSKKNSLNEENEDICPICMDVLSARPTAKFICKNHSAHIDCLEEYNISKSKNNQPLDCPFRDVQSNQEVAQHVEFSSEI